MINICRRELLWSIFLGIGLHALLFLSLLPDAVGLGQKRLAVPKTRYVFTGEGNSPMSSVEVRIVRSPAAFSLPSEMGFSHALAEMDVVTPLRTFSRPKQATSFLEVTPSIFSQEKVFSSEGFLFGVGTYQPALPNYLHSGEARPSARRISMTPELRERLVGGVVLPSELNQESENPWEVRAMVSISEQGVVEHVLLEDPLDESVMNQKVLLLLYNLRFRQGVAVEGEVEIYSPERSVLIERTQ